MFMGLESVKVYASCDDFLYPGALLPDRAHGKWVCADTATWHAMEGMHTHAR